MRKTSGWFIRLAYTRNDNEDCRSEGGEGGREGDIGQMDERGVEGLPIKELGNNLSGDAQI